MQYSITHSCGHQKAANIVGTDTHGERQRKAEWLATRLCPDCARQQRDAANQQENENAATRARAAGWPALTGTDRQVAWAETLRSTKTDQVREALRGSVSDSAAGEVLRMWERVVLAGHTDAAWWIEQSRYTKGLRLLYLNCTDEDKSRLRTLSEEAK